MYTYDYLLLAGSICGIIMVFGGMILLYKGVISLSHASSEGAFTVEFKKELRITTQYPALALFVIGLLFIGSSLWMGKSEVSKLTVRGKTSGVLEPVSITIKGNSWPSSLQHTGDVMDTFFPNVETVQIVVSAPGYESLVKTIQIHSLAGGTADLGDIKLKQVFSKTDVSEGDIDPVPGDVKLPPITASHAFGSVR